MRSYTFDVTRLLTADGVYDRITEGAEYYHLARKLETEGRVKLMLNFQGFTGYGDSYDEGYHLYNYTVVERPGKFI